MEPRFVADSFVKRFGKTEVLKSATAWATPGAVTVLFGRNGSGKTTLMRAAVGLLSFDFGLVRYEGRPSLKPALHRLAREGLMYLPGREFLSRRRTLAWHHRMLAIQMDMKPEEVLGDDPMKVSEFRHRERNLISGGERRRGEMSLVLARKPRCLLADEPLAGIGPKDQEGVAAALRRLADGGCAILVTGHDVNPLMALADDIIWMVGGTTHWMGSPESARDHYQFCREYLGPRGYRQEHSAR